MNKAVKRNKYWSCPFFKWDGEQEISCEGGRLCFPDRLSANLYMDTYCAGIDDAWRQCTVAAALYAYWERYYEKNEGRKRNEED